MQLPEKVGNKPARDDDSDLIYDVMEALNQLIDYLAERENPSGCGFPGCTSTHPQHGHGGSGQTDKKTKDIEKDNPDYSVVVWHKDGVGDTVNSPYGDVKVYRNGELALTDGKYEHLVIILEK